MTSSTTTTKADDDTTGGLEHGRFTDGPTGRARAHARGRWRAHVLSLSTAMMAARVHPYPYMSIPYIRYLGREIEATSRNTSGAMLPSPHPVACSRSQRVLCPTSHVAPRLETSRVSLVCCTTHAWRTAIRCPLVAPRSDGLVGMCTLPVWMPLPGLTGHSCMHALGGRAPEGRCGTRLCVLSYIYGL